MAQNMYRVGDYVYFEISSAAPFQVRRIEELNKTSTGNVEAKVMCFYRRRDISPALLKIADQLPPEKADKEKEKVPLTENGGGEVAAEEGGLSNGTKREEREDSASPAPMQVDESPEDKKDETLTKPPKVETNGGIGTAGLPTGADRIDGRERHRLRQRELFLSRQIETLPATHIRGKCVVTLLNEVETPDSYLTRDDAFFYSLVYDPSAKTLLADKGEIKVGSKFQADVVQAELITEEQQLTDRPEAMETLVFHPNHSLTDRDIDQFLIVARAVGTFSRALDTSSSVKLPSLHMTAAAASRDVTLLHAMALLHHANYDLGQAMKYLVPPPSKQHYPLDADKTTSHNTVSLGGPILCRDQMEEWSAAEANLFEEAIEKYGKDFNDIRQDFLPWKALKDIVEYYYMWKTTDRYVQSKRVKAAEAESRLKQVYIPNYNKPNPNLVGPPNPTGQPVKGTSPCESCETDMSPQWYAWGPAQLQMRLCADCWTGWKKNGGLKREHEYETYDKTGGGSKPLGGTDFVQNATGITRGTTLPNQQSHSRSAFGGQQAAKGAAAANRLMQGPMGAGGPKTRVAFFLHTTLMTRVARRLASRSLFNVRKSARKPFLPIAAQAIKQNCQSRDPKEILKVAKQIKGGRLPQGMIDALSGNRPAVVPGAAAATATTPGATLKRPVSNGDSKSTPQPPAKAPRQASQTTPVAMAQQQMYSRWLALTEDVLYLANRSVKRIRRTLTSKQMRNVARSPCKTNAAVTKLLPSIGFIGLSPNTNNNNVVVVE